MLVFLYQSFSKALSVFCRHDVLFLTKSYDLGISVLVFVSFACCLKNIILSYVWALCKCYYNSHFNMRTLINQFEFEFK